MQDLRGSQRELLHCTALHCTALHCTALHCINKFCLQLQCEEHHIEAPGKSLCSPQLSSLAVLHCIVAAHRVILVTVQFSSVAVLRLQRASLPLQWQGRPPSSSFLRCDIDKINPSLFTPSSSSSSSPSPLHCTRSTLYSKTPALYPKMPCIQNVNVFRQRVKHLKLVSCPSTSRKVLAQ